MNNQKTGVPDVLYHYTSAGGLLGILKPGAHSLWASAIGFSNDSSEGKYATELGREFLDDCCVLPTDPPGWEQVLIKSREWFTSTKHVRESAYSMSFCEEDNVLSQWRAYGGLASFSIGLRNMNRDVKSPSEMFLNMVKIRYNTDEQKELFLAEIANAKEVLLGTGVIVVDTPEGWKEENFRRVLAMTYFHRAIEKWAHTVKHQAFAEEKEWRLIATPTPEADQTDIQNDVYIREYKGRLLPYISLSPRSTMFDVESVTIGPSKTQPLEIKAVNLLLVKSGLTNVKVNVSDTPLQS
jgi:hypothetical protein